MLDYHHPCTPHLLAAQAEGQCAGACLAAAVVVPNVEFVLGLTGATAAALIMGILPAGSFLVAATPALTQGRLSLGITPGGCTMRQDDTFRWLGDMYAARGVARSSSHMLGRV